MRTRLLPALVGVLALPATAGADGGHLPAGIHSVDPTRTATLTAADTSCVTRTVRAAADGVLTAKLSGRGDWDLELRSGRVRVQSQAFEANEVIQGAVRAGRTVTLEACRREASASRTAELATTLVRMGARTAGSEKVQMAKVHITSQAAYDRLHASGLDVTHDTTATTARVVLYGASDLKALRGLRLDFEIVDRDLVASTTAAHRRDAARALETSPLPTGRTTFRTFADYERELKQWLDEFPSLTRPIALETKSFQGRDIPVVEITRDADAGNDGRPVFLLGAVHHAREWPAAETAMEFGWDLLRNGDTDPQLERVLDEVRVVVMPITNPDGFIVSRGAVDPTNDALGGYSTVSGFVLGAGGYKRKNCNPVVSQLDVLPCDAIRLGVDNNRNYGKDWGGPGASTNPHDQTYRGAGPFSDPETEAVRELSSITNAPVHMSLHNIAAKVLRPPGLVRDGLVPDDAAMEALGQRIADMTGYANEFGWQLYETTGSSKDWGYDALGQYSYTIELGPRGGDFHDSYKSGVIDQYTGRPGSDFEGLGMRAGLIESALSAVDRQQTSRITGTATPGAKLEITKTFVTKTFEVCLVSLRNPLNVNYPPALTSRGIDPGCPVTTEPIDVPERLELDMTVPSSGAFTWWLNPSTRPYVAKAGNVEAYTLTCTSPNGTSTQDVVIARGEERAIDLGAC